MFILHRYTKQFSDNLRTKNCSNKLNIVHILHKNNTPYKNVCVCEKLLDKTKTRHIHKCIVLTSCFKYINTIIEENTCMG